MVGGGRAAAPWKRETEASLAGAQSSAETVASQVGACQVVGLTAGLGAFMLAASFDLSRKLIIDTFLPAPGEGPSKQKRESGFFKMLLIGELKDGSTLRATVTGDRDPGYGSTSKMLSESAICLAKNDLKTGGGCWTPASAMGPVLRQRLIANAGLTFEIEN